MTLDNQKHVLLFKNIYKLENNLNFLHTKFIMLSSL